MMEKEQTEGPILYDVKQCYFIVQVTRQSVQRMLEDRLSKLGFDLPHCCYSLPL